MQELTLTSGDEQETSAEDHIVVCLVEFAGCHTHAPRKQQTHTEDWKHT